MCKRWPHGPEVLFGEEDNWPHQKFFNALKSGEVLWGKHIEHREIYCPSSERSERGGTLDVPPVRVALFSFRAHCRTSSDRRILRDVFCRTPRTERLFR